MNLVQRDGADLKFGVNSEWTAQGVLITRLSINTTGDKITAKDGGGVTIAANYTDDREEATFTGFVNGAPPAHAYKRGTVVTVITVSGTEYKYIVADVVRSEDNTKFREIELKLERYIDGQFP